MDNAWQAWWLSTHADLEDQATPPSRGRFIAALAEVEGRVGGDQLERKEYCDLAVADAIAPNGAESLPIERTTRPC